MVDLLLERIRRNKPVREALAELCEFDASRNDPGGEWFRIESTEQFEPIAGDFSGGVFLMGSSGRLMYVTSEGQVGVVALSLSEGIGVLVALPYWRDLLKFSAGGRLSEMKSAAMLFEHDFVDASHARARTTITASLSLPSVPDPIAILQSSIALHGSDVKVLAPDGCEFGSLFNTFTVGQYLANRKA